MNLDNLSEVLKKLMAEFESSGMSVDEFITAKLKASGREDAEDFVKKMNETLASIDKKFKSLQEFKENGGNREDWLRREVDNATEGISAENAGKVLSSTIKVLNGESDDTPDENATYDGIDAVKLISDLDDGIARNTLKAIAGEEDK